MPQPISTTFPYAYIRNKIVKIDEAVISIQCKVIQYGLGCFSGIRGNWNSKRKNLFLFRMEDHFERLSEGAKILGLNFPYTYPEFKKIIFDLIKKNNPKEDIYLRPIIYAGATTLTPRFDNPDDDFAVYMISLKDYFSGTEGLNVCISSWRRFDDDSISSKAKVTGSYVNCALAKSEAVANGYDEAIFLHRDGKVCEASSSNIFGIKDGVVYTPMLGENILNGITRRTILELLKKEMKMEVREESIDRSMLYCFDELFLTGTAAKTSWIKSVDGRQIGNGKMGPVTKKVKDLFEKVMTGNFKKYEKLLTKVYD